MGDRRLNVSLRRCVPVEHTHFVAQLQERSRKTGLKGAASAFVLYAALICRQPLSTLLPLSNQRVTKTNLPEASCDETPL
jgi:hypothetical protein